MTMLSQTAEASLSDAPRFDEESRFVRGKKRTISVPNDAMRAIHRRLIKRLSLIGHRRDLLDASYGALTGRSTIQNARQHAANRHFYKVDLVNAFTRVSMERLGKILHTLDASLGTKAEICAFLTDYCEGSSGGLRTGGPASPALFDLYCALAIDQPILGMLKDATYTRYLDDLTVSSSSPLPNILQRKIRDIVRSAGFEPSRHKSEILDRKLSAITIAGIIITPRGQLGLPPTFLAKVEAALRIPVKDVGLLPKKEALGHAYAFNGMASCLFAFASAGIDATLVTKDVKRLQREARQRLRELAHRNLLPRKPTRALPDFPPWFVARIQAEVPIEEVAARYWKLKRTGREFYTLSPFSHEKTPSFTIVPDKHFFHDFSSGKHGDVIDLVQLMEHLSFPDAVRALAKDFEICVP